jgi:predicted ATPase/DNA-binding CsgD family transcriptional regulator
VESKKVDVIVMQKNLALFPVKSYPANALPLSLVPLIGRENDRAFALSLLRRSEVRLITLVGTAGIGKTRLALQVATDISDECKVCFVDLAPIKDADLVLHAIAQALGLEETGKDPLLLLLQTYLRERSLILLLDNFEQVIGAAAQVSELLITCPQVKMIVTSREALHIRGEYQLPLKPLALPLENESLDIASLLQYAAIALFLHHAQSMKPDFQLTEVNARTIVDICARLDGIPLAIELAATQIKCFSAQKLLERLSSRLQVLKGGARDLPDRQQTIYNTIKWSYELLTAQEQWIFRQLALFTGGATLDAVKVVCECDDDSEMIVSSLLDKSLLQQREQQDAESRFLMLGTLREYGVEQLRVRAEIEQVTQRYTRYYLAFAEQAEPELKKARQAFWLERLEMEHANLRAVLADLLERQCGEMALRLCCALWWFWYVRGYYREGYEWFERALALTTHTYTVVRGSALYAAGILALYHDCAALAENLCSESLTLFRQLDDLPGIATALHKLALVVWARGRFRDARNMLEDSLQRFHNLGYEQEAAVLQVRLGIVACFQEGDTQGYMLIEQGLGQLRKLKAQWYVAYTLNFLADRAIKQGDPGRARPLIEESIGISREIGYQHGIALSLRHLAQVILLQGDTQTALSLAEKSLILSKGLAQHWSSIRWHFYPAGSHWSHTDNVQDLWHTAHLLSFLASIATFQRDEEAASALYEESKAILEQWEQHENGSVALLSVSEQSASYHAEVKDVESGVAASLSPLPDGLTTREVEVIRLVATGLTNAEVAEKLVLSIRTVNAHLRSIYNKLSISSRVAVTRYAIEQKLV